MNKRKFMAARSKIISAYVLLCLLVASGVGLGIVNLVRANFLFPSIPTIIISDNGDYSSGPIERNGNVFVFKSNIENCTILVDSDNVILDGAGYTLQGLTSAFGPEAIWIKEGSSNITIQNMYIKLFHTGIRSYGSSNITITRNVMYTLQGIDFGHTCSNNRFIENTFSCPLPGYGCGVWITSGFNNTILNNNFFYFHSNLRLFNTSANSVSMNYWSDYNGTDLDGDGIGDTPYTIQTAGIYYSPLIYDYSPLIKPISIQLPNPNPEASPTPTPTPADDQSEPDPTPDDTPFESSPTPSPFPDTPDDQSEFPTSTPQEPVLSMPQEYLTYTIEDRNGVPWAIIDGTYPIYCSNAENFSSIPMVYPVPPATTNITITLNSTNLSWTNFAAQFPNALHHTVLGDWAMVYTEFNLSSFFTLSIHYEHPITLANGSYQFLYDLNIESYLSSYCPNSTAFFTLKTEKTLPNFKIFTVPNDTAREEKNYASQSNGSQQTVTFEVTSGFNKTLPGDVLFTFSNGKTIQDSTQAEIILSVALATILAAILLAYFKKRKQ